MPKPILLLKTLLKLGLCNVIYVAWYRFSLKSGIRKYWFPVKQLPSQEDFFLPAKQRTDYPEEWKSPLLEDAEKIVSGNLRYYSCHWKEVGSPPNWFLNPFNGNTYPNPHLHWTKLPDFHPSVGDIKNIWEASRFEWVVTLARAYAITADEKYLLTLNSWLKDWALKNPLNTGPNWKCGQETSIRVFNLLNAAYILQQHSHPSEALVKFIEAHLERISPNIRYAIAQDNNHGTSEAAGLFIGGSWLAKANAKANANAKKGRHWLENRLKKLVTTSGSFSQHSLTYQRVLTDTLCFAEFWRKTLNAEPFSNHFYQKAAAATNWLYQVVDTNSGDAPNLGSNDGALLLNTHSCNYRDFRPTLQMAARLFFDSIWFNNGVQNEALYWFNINDQFTIKAPQKNSFSAHGFATLQGEHTWALVKWPYYTFRPSHNDALHVDIWYKGENIICDSGTYSYNPGNDFQQDLKSVHFHNTVSFDNREQMPKLSRFLLANWLKADTAAFESTGKIAAQKWTGSYTDSFGNRHVRNVELAANQWIITDTLSGCFKNAVIGFNLKDQELILKGTTISATSFNIQCPDQAQSSIANTYISEHYMEKHLVKRLRLEVSQPGVYTTRIILKGPLTEKSI